MQHLGLAADVDRAGHVRKLEWVAGPQHDVCDCAGPKDTVVRAHAIGLGKGGRDGRKRNLGRQAVGDCNAGLLGDVPNVVRFTHHRDADGHAGCVEQCGRVHAGAETIEPAG